MRAWVIPAACLVMSVVGTSAQAPSFTGTWRLNQAAGDPPSRGTNEILFDVSQTATDLTLRLITNGAERSRVTWPLDGRAIEVKRDGFAESTSVAIGKGELVITGSRQTADGGKADYREHWLLDPATKSLRVSKISSTIATTFSQRLVLDPVAKP